MSARRAGVELEVDHATSEDVHRLHTLEVAAERLSVSLRTLRNYIDLRRIHVVRIGRSVRVSELEIRRIVRDGVSEL
jgi:excisionase family DNA binding protein